MRIAFGQLMSGLTILFAAFEQLAKALLSIFTTASEAAATFEDEMRIERIQKRKAAELAAGITIEGEPLKAVKAVKAA